MERSRSVGSHNRRAMGRYGVSRAPDPEREVARSISFFLAVTRDELALGAAEAVRVEAAIEGPAGRFGAHAVAHALAAHESDAGDGDLGAVLGTARAIDDVDDADEGARATSAATTEGLLPCPGRVRCAVVGTRAVYVGIARTRAARAVDAGGRLSWLRQADV
jgi:hypothetical protein